MGALISLVTGVWPSVFAFAAFLGFLSFYTATEVPVSPAVPPTYQLQASKKLVNLSYLLLWRCECRCIISLQFPLMHDMWLL